MGVVPQSFAQNSVLNTCPAGWVFSDDGLASGCVKTNAQGQAVKFGKWVYRDQNKNIIEEASYNPEGKPDGALRVYYGIADDGTKAIKELAHYSNGKLMGPWMSWYANGQIKEERSYVQGQMHGVRKRWQENGAPNGMECFVKNQRFELEACSGLDANASRLPASSQ